MGRARALIGPVEFPPKLDVYQEDDLLYQQKWGEHVAAVNSAPNIARPLLNHDLALVRGLGVVVALTIEYANQLASKL